MITVSWWFYSDNCPQKLLSCVRNHTHIQEYFKRYDADTSVSTSVVDISPVSTTRPSIPAPMRSPVPPVSLPATREWHLRSNPAVMFISRDCNGRRFHNRYLASYQFSIPDILSCNFWKERLGWFHKETMPLCCHSKITLP